jgi:hypothetical protein
MLTIAFALSGVYGYHRDRQDLILLIEDEIKDLPKDKEILEIEAKIRGFSSIPEEDGTLMNPDG